MDFIEELPNSYGFNSILVMVDRLTKWAIQAKSVDDLVEPSNEIPPAFERVKSIIDVHLLCCENIELANEDYAKYYNAKRREELDIDIGDMVLLSLEDLAT